MDERLLFPIGFSLDDASEDVIAQWQALSPKIEKKLKPINVGLNIKASDLTNLEDVNNRLKQVKLEPVTPETQRAIKDLVNNLKELKKILELVDKQQRKIGVPNQRAAQVGTAESVRAARAAEINERAAQRQAQANAKLLVDRERLRQAALRTEQAELRLATAKEKVTNATSRQNAAYRTQTSYLQHLVSRMAIYFSVGQVIQFAQGIREVTAEFELQRVALGALIQDTEKSYELFNQIKAAAVESPFQIKDLVTYTKQLAAYRIEQEELFEWTTRLADISAGLGVQMDRLILAFGQIRATSYLRGSEVRQLTEAGIPIVDALAEHFTKLRGEMVSTAEVFQMISDKAVSFSTVEKIFRDMTDAGGMFYNMQKTQAKTLAGQWSNLIDVMNIAQAEMGEEMRGEIEGLISSVKFLWENWGSVLNVIQGVASIGAVMYIHNLKAAKAQQHYNSVLGESVVTRYKDVLAAEKQAIAQHKINLATERALKGKTANYTTNFIATEKALLRQAIVTGRLSKQEAIRAISLGQVSKAQRKVMFEMGLLDKAQIKAALSMQNLVRGGTLLQRTWSRVAISVTNAAKSFAAFAKSNWIFAVIGAITSLFFEMREKNKIVEEEQTRILDNQKEITQELKRINDDVSKTFDTPVEKTIALSDAIKKLEDRLDKMGNIGANALLSITPDMTLQERYDTLANTISTLIKDTAFLQQIFAERFGDLEGTLFGVNFFGDNLQTDLKQMDKSVKKLYLGRDIEADLLEFRAELTRRTKELSEAERIRYRNILDGQRAYESEDDYVRRLAKAYVDLKAYASGSGVALLDLFKGADFNEVQTRFLSIQQTLTSTQKLALSDMSSAYEKAHSDIREVGDELEKDLDRVMNKFDIEKLLKENNAQGLQEVVLAIKTVFADDAYGLSEIAQQLGVEEYANRLQIPLDLVVTIPKLDAANYNAIQQALSSSELFDTKQIEDTNNKIKAQELLQGVLDKEVAMKEIIKKADEEAYNTAMDRYKSLAEASKNELQQRIDSAREQQKDYSPSSKEFESFSKYILNAENAISNYDKQIEESQVPFREFVKKQGEIYESMKANSKQAFDTADAIGVLIGYGKKGGGGGGDTDPYIILLKQRMSFMKDFQKSVEDLNKVMFSEDALSQGQGIMLERGMSLGINTSELKGTADELSKWYDDTIDELQNKIYGLGGSKLFSENTVEAILSTDTKNKVINAYQKLLQEVFNAQTDFNTKKLENKIKSEISRLQDKINQTQQREDFFNNILGLTGDHDMAMSLTMSIYGDMGEDIAENIKKQLEEAFKGIDITEYINGSDVNYVGLSKKINELPENQQKLAKDLVDKGIANNAKIIQDYAKYLAKYADLKQKEVNIDKTAAFEKQKLDEGLVLAIKGLTEEEIKSMTEQVNKAKQSIDSLAEWDKIKLSDDYINYFKEFSTLSTDTAAIIKNTLQAELIEAFRQGGLSAKEFQREMDVINKQFEEISKQPNAFKSYFEEGIEGLMEFKSSQASALFGLGEEVSKMDSVSQISQGDKNFINKMVDGGLDGLLDKFGGDMGKIGGEISNIGGKMQGAIGGAAGALSIVDMIIKAVNDTIVSIGAVIKELNATRSEDNQLGGWYKYIEDFNKHAYEGWENLKSGNIAGAIASTINSIISIFNNVQRDKIKRLNEDIENQEELIEDLEYAYGRLQKAAEDALGVDYIKNYNEQVENLLASAEAAEKIADSERAKGKSAEQDAIDAAMDEARDYRDEATDMINEFSANIMGSSLADFAKEIANIWLTAKLAGEDTYDALMKKNKELVQSMVTDFLLAAAIEAALEPVFKKIDELKESPNKANDPNFWASVASVLTESLGTADVILENLFNALGKAGVDLSDTESGLQGISKEFGQASETAILGLTQAYNTNNFYMSRVDMNVAAILLLIQTKYGGNVISNMSLTAEQDSYLSQLPTIAQNTANTVAECKNIVTATKSIAESLNAVIKPKGTSATKAIHMQ